MKHTAFDFVVVGAGAAGCAAARALAVAHPEASIALVEQGVRRHGAPLMRVPALQPFLPHLRSARPFMRRLPSAPEKNLGGRVLDYVRGCGLGGSTLMDEMRYMRGTAADLASWADPAWSFEALLPFYTRLEANTRGAQLPVHNDRGLLPISDANRSSVDSALNVRFFEACEAAGVPATADFNGGTADGFSSFQSLIQRGARVDVFDALVEQERHRTPRLSVLTETRAERIVFEGKRAVGLVVTSSKGAKGDETQLACGSLILCLGAIDSPALLHRSGVGKGGAVLDQSAVGGNLIQGCLVDLVFAARANMGAASSRSLSWRNLPYLSRQWREYREDGTGIFATLAEAGAYVRSRPDLTAPDLSLVLHRTPQVGWRGWRRTLQSMEGVTVRVTHHYPASRGEVGYDADTRRTIVRSGLLSERGDVVSMDEGTRWVGLLLSRESALKSVFHEDEKGNHVGPFWALNTVITHPRSGLRSQRDTAAFLAQYAEGSPDIFGTCALGSVVDSALKVRGLQGVMVADASIVPQPTVASSATIGAVIGSRVAELMEG